VQQSADTRKAWAYVSQCPRRGESRARNPGA